MSFRFGGKTGRLGSIRNSDKLLGAVLREKRVAVTGELATAFDVLLATNYDEPVVHVDQGKREVRTRLLYPKR